MTQRSVISIGNFDGVHVGHQRIVRQARALASSHGAVVKVLTFTKHPAQVLRPGKAPTRLMSAASKRAALLGCGADEVVMMEPTPELLGLSAEAFVDQLVSEHRPVGFVEGGDFRFGHDRQGDVRMLAKLGQTKGFTVEVVAQEEVALDDQLVGPVSSSLVRWLLGAGRVADVSRCLGRDYEVSGDVVSGERRGRRIGVPTINIEVAAGMQWPGDGVYAGVARVGGEEALWAAAISIGVKPTFGERRRVLEAHLLDYEGDCYGQEATLRFSRWLRGQRPFPGVEALKAQLARDIEQVRRWREREAVCEAR